MPHSANVLQPPRASRIIRPGMPALGPGGERYRVKGRGSTVIRVSAGDTVVVTDTEGGQLCEITFIDAAGQFNAAGLGVAFSRTASGLQDILSEGGDSASRTLAALRRRGADLSKAAALTVFGGGSAPGSSAALTMTMDGLLVVVAPGAPMDFDRQDTSTAISIMVQRARLSRSYEETLPEPMADPLQDLRIAAASASAYFVRAGEFIQIIDVAGRQCTDFQAFAARKVDKGLDRAIDATVTRTLLSRSYPTPGLPSKCFDRDFEPLVEIVQDTVGRHDAFATACNSRYYDDMGYPGHANCTDNFNDALSPFGVLPAKAGRRSTISTTPT